MYEYHYVPKIKKLNNKLFEYHCNNFHCNEKDLIYIFLKSIKLILWNAINHTRLCKKLY